MSQSKNPYLDKRNNSTTYLIDWLLYSVIFYILLLPFIEYGWLKIGSVAMILGFFAGILNRFFREYYAFKDEDHSKVGKVNRVTDVHHDPGSVVYAEDYQPNFTDRSIPHKKYKRSSGERAPDKP